MTKFIFTLSLIACMMWASSTLAANIVVGVSPYLQKDQAHATYKSIVTFALESLNAGDTAIIYDAYNLRSIGTITIPQNAAYQHMRTRAHMNAEAIKAFRDFAVNTNPTDENQESIKLPEFLRWIGELHNNDDHKALDVIIVGSPLYHDPEQPAFSMRDGRIPGDGHLQNSVSRTVFGIDNPELLKNIRLHIGYPEEFAAHDQHHWHVKRFWTLFAEKQAGELVSFTGDLSTLLNRVKKNTNAPKHSYELEDATRLEVIQLAPVELKETRSIFQRPLEKGNLSPSDMKAARDVQIGITWDCTQCDLDLHVRPHASADVLSFRRTQTEEGRYWKDFRNAPAHGYETIDLSGVTDLRDVLIAVNFYSGETASPLTGQIRLAVGNKTYAKTFTINASSGNNGKGADSIWRSRTSTFPQWIIIDPKLVVSTSK